MCAFVLEVVIVDATLNDRLNDVLLDKCCEDIECNVGDSLTSDKVAEIISDFRETHLLKGDWQDVKRIVYSMC